MVSTAGDMANGLEWIGNAAESLPVSAHGVAFLVLGVGLVLLFVGGRFLRIGFVAAGGAIGAAMGYFAPAVLGITLHPIVAAGVLGLAGILLGWLALRITVALVLALVLGVAFPAGTSVALDMSAALERATTEAGSGALTPEAMLLPGVPVLEEGEDPPQAPQTPAAKPTAGWGTTADKVRRFVVALGGELRLIWNELPRDTRMKLFWSGVLGALAGLVAGFAAPKRAGAVTTSLVGSGMVLFAILWGALMVEEGALGSLGRFPWAWAGGWLGLAAIGIGVQWTRKGREADTPS